MLNWLKTAYYRIPKYGQLMLRKGTRECGWYKSNNVDTYFSLMLKGKGRGIFGSKRFYLVITEKCLEEIIERGNKNLKYNPNIIPFGSYTGIYSVTSDRVGNLPPQTFDCVYLHVFRYFPGGKIKDFIVVLSVRQFRRGIARAKNHPELVVKRRFRDWFIIRLFRLLRLNKK